MKTELEKLVDYIENSEAAKDLKALKAYHCILEVAKHHLKEEAEQLALFEVVQVKPEICQCYDDDIGMYLKGIEYYCASCDLPIKAN